MTVIPFPSRRRSALPRDLGEWIDTGCKAIIVGSLMAGAGFFVFAFGALFHAWAWWA